MSKINVEEIISRLSSKTPFEILNWMASNLEQQPLLECLKEINPLSFKKWQDKEKTKTLQGDFPVNYTYKTNTINDLILGLIELSKTTKYIPIAYLPFRYEIGPKSEQDFTVIYLTQTTTRKGIVQVNEGKPEGKSFEDYIQMVISSKGTVKKMKDKEKISSAEALSAFKKFIVNNPDERFDFNRDTNQIEINRTILDFRYYMFPYGLSPVWEKGPVHHIHSDIYAKEIKTSFNKTRGTNCVLTGYDGRRKCGNHNLIKRFEKNSKGEIKEDEYGWYSDNDIDTWCGTNKKASNFKLEDGNVLPEKLSAMDTAIMMNNLKGGVPFHSRVWDHYMDDGQWDSKGDLRMLTRGDYKARYSNIIPVENTSCPSDRYFVGQEVPSEQEDIPEDLIGTFAQGTNPEKYKKSLASIAECDNKFGNIQRKAASKNIYITALKFGEKTNKFYVYVFDKNKSKKWSTDRKGKNIEGSWVTPAQLKKIYNNQRDTRISKESTNNFMKFQNVMIPDKHITPENVVPLSSLPVNYFGYYKKTFPVDRSYGQLYPLGRDAYFTGRHQGVSSTFSQKFSEDHGLWNPTKKIPAKQKIVGQFQYGRGGMKRKNKSCFGSSAYSSKPGKGVPNTWSRKGTRNYYTGKKMAGIARPMYGYRGTQGPYGGYTGVVGGVALGNQQISQGLVPLKFMERK